MLDRIRTLLGVESLRCAFGLHAWSGWVLWSPGDMWLRGDPDAYRDCARCGDQERRPL